MHADNRQAVETLHAGEVGAVVGLGETRTGDTICNEKHPIVLESIEFPTPVIGLAVTPESRIDRDNLSKALVRLAEEDPTFTVAANQETGDIVISGMGELHLEIIVDRLKREFNVSTKVGNPQVAYRETVVGSVEHVHKHVKQTGGHGQYAHVKIEVRPGGAWLRPSLRRPCDRREHPQGVHSRRRARRRRRDGRGTLRGLSDGRRLRGAA